MIVPEIKHSYTFSCKVKKRELFQITCSKDAYACLKQIYEAHTTGWVEEFFVLYLNVANRVVGFQHIGKGSVNCVTVDVKIILMHALNLGAFSIIVSHNHPSGNIIPSDSDKVLTHKINSAAKHFDIILADHIIYTDEGDYYSFADNGGISR